MLKIAKFTDVCMTGGIIPPVIQTSVNFTMCGFIAQLVEHRTGIAEFMGSNLVEALIFFRLLLSNCLNWKIYCDDHTSLSSTTAVQI